jgi:pyruvate/2-oxoglutarate dehydrogenase complex dihydrolipoamide acyltransferase (E2) component
MDNREFNNEWRVSASAIYRKPLDSKMYGSVELDVTELEDFIRAKRNEGLKITMTHFFLLAIARAFRHAVPEMNCFVRRGKIIHRQSVDATLSVIVKERTQMGSVRLDHADTLSLAEAALLLVAELKKSRGGEENKAMAGKSLLAAIPWPFRSAILRLVQFLTVGLGINFPGLGLRSDSFGSFLLTNIGSVGIDLGYAALMPLSNVSAVFSMGMPQSKPAVINGEVVPRRILTMSAVIDHRVADGIHAGHLFRYLKAALRDPQSFELPNP